MTYVIAAPIVVFRKADENAHDKGGCLAMAIEGSLIAMVSPKKLELHILDDLGTPCLSRKVSEFELPSPFASARLMFGTTSRHATPSSTSFITLRLVLSRANEMHLYEVIIPPSEDIYFHEIWRHEIAETWDISLPRFGARAAAVAWLSGSRLPKAMPCSDPVVYMATSVPLGIPFDDTSRDKELDIPRASSNTDSIALWGLAVHDFDETRGLVVLGNAFGELVLFDHSGSDAAALAACFEDLTFHDMASTGDARMPSVSSSFRFTVFDIVY